MILTMRRRRNQYDRHRATLHKRLKERQATIWTVNKNMTTTREEKKRFWNKILFEVLESEYVTDFIGSVLADIREGKKAFENTDHAEPYGFGEDCYYKSKRKLIEDAVYQFFDTDVEEQSKTLAEWIVQEVRDGLEIEINTITDVTDNISSRFGRARVEISVDYSSILAHAREWVDARLKEKTDKEIEEIIAKTEATHKE